MKKSPKGINNYYLKVFFIFGFRTIRWVPGASSALVIRIRLPIDK